MAGHALARTLAVAAVAVGGAAAAAWMGAGALVRHSVAADLPAVPDLSSAPRAVQEAVRAADRVARTRPTSATVGALGRAYHGAQLAGPAMASYAAAARLDPDDPRWPYLQAVVLEERSAAEAVAQLRRVVVLSPSLGHAWWRLGEVASRQGRAEEARTAFERAIDAPAVPAFQAPGMGTRTSAPLSAYARVGLARLDLDAGRRDDAAARLESLLDAYPAFGPALVLARLAASGGEPARVRRAPDVYVPPADPLVDAVVAESVHSDVLLKHAGLATRAGDSAWRDFLVRRAHAFNPDDLNVLMELASLHEAAGRRDDALAALRRHEALAPGDHHGLVQQGRVLSDVGRLAEAEAVLRRAIVVRDAAAEFNLGAVLDAQGRWDEAREHYERALAIDPFHTRAMNNLGVGWDRRGDTAAALRWFAAALSVTPEAADVRSNQGAALLRAGRAADAADALREAVALDPRAANAHNNLGIALATLGDLPAARAAFERALAVDPRHADARRNLDRVLAARGLSPFKPGAD